MSVVDAALEDAAASLGLEGGAIAPSELAAVGVTQGPGLVGALVAVSYTHLSAQYPGAAIMAAKSAARAGAGYVAVAAPRCV